MTYSFTERAAHCHELNLSAFRAGLMGGRVFQTSLAITVMTDGSAVRIARYHRPDFSAFRTALVGGKVSVTSHGIARRANFLAGLTVLTNNLVLPTSITNTLHVSPPLCILDIEFEKNEAGLRAQKSILPRQLTCVKAEGKNPYFKPFSSY